MLLAGTLLHFICNFSTQAPATSSTGTQNPANNVHLVDVRAQAPATSSPQVCIQSPVCPTGNGVHNASPEMFDASLEQKRNWSNILARILPLVLRGTRDSEAYVRASAYKCMCSLGVGLLHDAVVVLGLIRNEMDGSSGEHRDIYEIYIGDHRNTDVYSTKGPDDTDDAGTVHNSQSESELQRSLDTLIQRGLTDGDAFVRRSAVELLHVHLEQLCVEESVCLHTCSSNNKNHAYMYGVWSDWLMKLVKDVDWEVSMCVCICLWNSWVCACIHDFWSE
jgi:hypothetical protein